MSVEDRLSLAADFPPADREQWRRLVAGVLARSGMAIDEQRPEAALTSVGYDGIELWPLYTADDLPPGDVGLPGRPPFVRGAGPAGGLGWEVRSCYRAADPVLLNQAVLADLANGASSVWLHVDGTALPSTELAHALDGVYLDLVSVVLDGDGDYRDRAREFLQLVSALPAAEVRGNLGADPIGRAARLGGDVDLSSLPTLVELAAAHPNLLPITVDATGYHEAGGSDTDELAISIAVAVAYLRCLTDAGHDVDSAYAALEFRYAVTADQFGSIAKLRAARRIWDRIGELSGVAARPGQRQHAVTSTAMMTQRDPWVNMLRTTIGCFAAAVGGAQAVTVLPFDSALGLPDDLGRRIARNTQAILHDESSLARVADPAGGSFFVESLTDQLAEAGWRKFTELEAAGGAVAALESGLIADLLERSWQLRRRNLAERRDPITGVSEFAQRDEQLLTRPPAAANVAASGSAAGQRQPLPRHRYAEEYEQLRDRSDELLARTGRRPTVLLATLGPVPAHAARVGFATNLLHAGGVDSVVVAADDDQLAAVVEGSGARIACLCSSDKEYAEHAVQAAAALKAAGVDSVWIAGPAELIGGDIDGALYRGCDALSRLRSIHEASAA